MKYFLIINFLLALLMPTSCKAAEIPELSPETIVKKAPKLVAYCPTGEAQCPEKDEATACDAAGAMWQMFRNGCVDHCSSQRGEKEICTQALTQGCECGENKCWNGESCEDI